jgi:hypothetical protein
MMYCPILGFSGEAMTPLDQKSHLWNMISINNSHVPNNASKIESKINYSSKF